MDKPEMDTPANATALREIVVVGGGSAGWMTAAALSSLLDPAQTRITLVESDAIGTVGVGEATIPDMINFNAMLGIREDEFVAATDATFKLGIEFVGWKRKGESYFHPFGSHGVDMQGIDFHQYWLALHRRGDAHPISDYSICARAAYEGRFAHPVQDTRSPLSHLRYAYHLDATRYAAFLRRYAEARGVQRVEGRVEDVRLDAESGDIRELALSDGRTVSGELFFDCTGFRALLMRGALGVGWEDWSHWLPCDTAQTVASAHNGPPAPFTRATAREAGWQWRIPTQRRIGNGHIYASAHMSDDDARDVLMDSLDSEPLGEPRTIRFRTGRLDRMWERNCIAVGLSAGFLEPLESTSLYLIQMGISKLITLYPDAAPAPVVVEEYNRQMRQQFAQVRDFIILHYCATERDDSPFWNHCRTMELPDSLRHKMELFGAAGRVFRHEDELFSVPSWVAVMLGQGIVPRTLDPIVAQLPAEQVAHSLATMREGLGRAARSLPAHGDYIDRFARRAA